MNRSHSLNSTIPFNNAQELAKKAAIHEAGHSAAIYLSNKEKQLPPVFFQIHLNKSFIEQNNEMYFSARVEGGRLIHTLPCSMQSAMADFSPAQKYAYQLAFEADIINLLAGSLAEAYYVAWRDNEEFNPRLIHLNALSNYGGALDLNIVQTYLNCMQLTGEERELKIQSLFLNAFYFVSQRNNWQAITALAQYILRENKSLITYTEIAQILDCYAM